MSEAITRPNEAIGCTIYRGYEIRKGTTGYWIYKADAEACNKVFPTEDAASDEIDRWKREAAKAGAA